MSIKTTIKDGTGTGLEVKVDKSGPKDENSLWVHLSGITPEVTIPVFNAPLAEASIFDDFLKTSGGSEQMAVDGSSTSKQFRLESDDVFDIIITDVVFAGQDGSIKMSKWFSDNNPLTNGVTFTFKSDDAMSSFPSIKTTHRLLSFSSGDTLLVSETGEATVLSFRKFSPPIIVRKTGTHGPEAADNDFIQVEIQDNLSSMSDFTCTIRGIKVPAGVF